ncbi:MAG TPA: hypothetical protein VLK37_03420 [Solirubrobacterales bacterium]|nr:hypothetical protein [Solirubrobacterales bacterium]
MDGFGAQRLFARGGWALAAVTMALVAFAVPGAQGAERVLDPVLSLVGGCSGKVEALDPVEDPGCPTTPPATSNHPAALFAVPQAVTTDFYGNIYVSNFGKQANGSQGRIDIFDPEGVFISELKVGAPMSMAVDSKGNLYLVREIISEGTSRRLFRYAPTTYEPAAGNIQYGEATASLEQPGSTPGSLYTGLSINQADDHLFANYGGGEGVIEYSSAAGSNAIVGRSITPGSGPHGIGVAVDASRDRLYASAGFGFSPVRIDIFDLNQPEGASPEVAYKKVGSIPGTAVPEGRFGDELSIAVDEGTGHVFALDIEANRVYEFDAAGTYLATLEHGFTVTFGAELGVDNGPSSPNGALSTKGRYLYVPSGKGSATGHSYAFEESDTRAPVVKSTSTAGISENEAELQTSVNPGNLTTSYTFEITTEEDFEAEEFNGATVAGSGKLQPGNLDDEAFAVAAGLEPGTAYRFRIVASNEKGSDELQGTFSTYPSEPVETEPCGNKGLRAGFSALLPDCRAYELVTPADTNGRAPVGEGRETGTFFTREVSPDGSKIPFRVEGGSLPGIGGTGSYQGDPFVSSRGPGGWSTASIGPTGEEAASVIPGGTSADRGYSFFTAERAGSAVIEGKSTSYLRFPDGHAELLGAGSVGTDYEAAGFFISEGGSHVIFGTGAGTGEITAVQLEPNAAPSGTRAIYDRTPDGTLHVVSLMAADTPLSAGEGAEYQGTSLDGRGVAFTVSSKGLFLRYQNSETFEIGKDVKFAGLTERGNFVFYMKDGRLWRFDALTGERVPFSSGVVTPVNVASDASAAYFVSTAKLTTEANPNGALAKAGKQNLYLSREGAIKFVGAVTERDVAGEQLGTGQQVDGLGLWLNLLQAPGPGRFGADPSRVSPDGSALLFQSRAPLAGYDPDGHAMVYRYSEAGELQCLSCIPTGAAATADATLQSEQREGFALFNTLTWIQNLRPDGRRAIFQSLEALVPGDTDGRQDVYEWEDEGVGSCTRPEGCLFLVSSGHSSRNDYLWAVSESGDDIFLLSSDRLLPADLDETPSIYDARVGGGFSEPTSAECQGEGCRPQMSPTPALPAIQTPVQGSGDNVKPNKPRNCGKGKRKVTRGGKVRCVKKHRAGSNQKGAHK